MTPHARIAPPPHRLRLDRPWRAPRLLAMALSVLMLLPAAARAADLQLALVRHAEKASDDPRDPSLSAAGQARAAALATALRDAGVVAVYATQFRRTQQTAAPTAAAAGLELTVRPASGEVLQDAEAFATELKARHADGGTVLVVGHSNTIPALAAALLGEAAGVAPMPEDEFDRLMLVTLPEASTARPRLLLARYGQAPAAPAADNPATP